MAAMALAPSLALLVPSGAQAQSGGRAGTTGDRPLRLVALGDSLTAGYGLPAEAAFPVVLETQLRARGHKVEIANAGVSGDTSQAGLERLDWSVPDGTDGVIVSLGANDALRGIDPRQTAKALEEIVSRLKQRNIAVMVAGMLAPPNLGADYGRRFEAVYTDLVARHGLVLYPFFLDGVVGDRRLNLPDGIHPTAQGIRVIVERILPTVETFLARLRVRT
jgi:acyl-CoA thioesterase-1